MKYRWLWAVAATGVALHLGGLGWDAYLHARDSTLAEREGIFTLSNPSHALIIGGLALTTGALLAMALTWAQEREFGGPGLAARTIRVTTLPVVALGAAGAIWLASLAEDTSSHAHNEPTDHADAHVDAGVSDSDAQVAGDSHTHSEADPDAMSEADAHTHGVEVDVSPEQLAAASQFYADVKASTAKYEDIRVAMANGYVQVTQDLPGIAAHFVNFTYNNDSVLMDPAHPESLLYTKRLDGEWRLVGAMFTTEKVTDEPPSFFGPLDVWHRHENLCFTPNAVSVKPNKESCPGVFQATTAWMLHVWTAPGASGAFAHDFAPISPGAFPGATRPASQELVSRP